ncbi:hypothetical protein BH10PLA2_BH10PLA2_10800 [soil metagenome]
MTTVCPRCHHAINVNDIQATQAIHCARCGSSFDSETAAAGVWNVQGQPLEALPQATLDTATDATAIWGLKAGTTKFDRFELLGELGKGAFGTVYKARDLELDRVVAILPYLDTIRLLQAGNCTWN